jgi:hypothetical protein
MIIPAQVPPNVILTPADPAKFNDLLRALQEGDEFFTQEKYGNGYIVLAQPELKAASGAVGKGKAGKKAGKAKGKGNGKAEEEMPFPPQQEAEEKKEVFFSEVKIRLARNTIIIIYFFFLQAQEPEQKVEEKPGEKKETVLYEEFHPFLFEQFKVRTEAAFVTSCSDLTSPADSQVPRVSHVRQGGRRVLLEDRIPAAGVGETEAGNATSDWRFSESLYLHMCICLFLRGGVHESAEGTMQEHSIEERLEKVRADQSRRIAELQKALMSNEFCARLIEQNVEDVRISLRVCGPCLCA